MNHVLTSTAVLGILRARFPALGQDTVHIFDTAYVPLEDSGAVEYFQTLSRDAQSALKKWELNRSDCDKYARTVALLALLGHSNYSAAQTGIAVGVICYVDGAKGRHAATLMLTARTEKGQRVYSARVFEPQDGRELTLMRAERESIYRIML